MKTTYVINVGKNNYHKKRKNNCIETPRELSLYLSDIVNTKYPLSGYHLFDICCGPGNLSYGFAKKKATCIGIDIKKSNYKNTYKSKFIKTDFIDSKHDGKFDTMAAYRKRIVVCNPPFNYTEITPDSVTKYCKQKGWKRPLLPQIFLSRIFDIWGQKTPVILFTPMGFLRNQRITANGYSERYTWLLSLQAKITSVVTVPMNIFQGAIVHSDILIFNMPKLKPHYLFPKL